MPCQLTIPFMKISLQSVKLLDFTQGKNFKTQSHYSQILPQLCQLGSHNTLFLHGYGNSVYSILTCRFHYNKLCSLLIHKKQFFIYIKDLSWDCSNSQCLGSTSNFSFVDIATTFVSTSPTEILTLGKSSMKDGINVYQILVIVDILTSSHK